MHSLAAAAAKKRSCSTLQKQLSPKQGSETHTDKPASVPQRCNNLEAIAG